jgi:hypothetical protein
MPGWAEKTPATVRDGPLMSLRAFIATLLIFAPSLWAGPPFVTDDPEPVEHDHWEVYLASILTRDGSGWSGTAPHVEVNYGVITNLQLHVIAPVGFVAPNRGPIRFGYGTTELGVKYRFVEETDHLPQIGVFPLLEVPTGDRSRGLSNGHLQQFTPVWLQKSWGAGDRPWTTYGGGGYWINPGAGNRNWGFLGWLLQKQLTEKLALGTEVYYETAQQAGGDSSTVINAGGIYDLSETYHLMASIGHSVQGTDSLVAYAAFQLTFGPGK